MIRKNLIVSIVTIENKSEEIVLDLKTSNNRTDIVLEPRLQKLVLDINELKEAIREVEEFSNENPSDVQKKQVEVVENSMVVEIGVDDDMLI